MVARPPLLPPTANIQTQIISDSSGLSYMLAQVAGDGMLTWRLHLAWGISVVQPEHVAIVMG